METRAAQYALHQVARLSGATADQLRGWDRSGLLPADRPDGRPIYTFQDVIAARAAVALIARGVPTRRVRQAVEAVRTWRPEGGHPLAELRLFEDGGQVVVRIDDTLIDPVSGQGVLELAEEARGPEGAVLEVPPRQAEPTDAHGWLQLGLEAEEQGDDGTAEERYRRALSHDPDHAGVLLNLGNIAYRRGDLEEATSHYREATRAEPEYAEAWYNLANAFDDLGQLDAAAGAYETALRLEPELADAHFNLALLWEKAGQRLRARRHWEQYVLLDTDSESARIAREFLSYEEGFEP